MSETDEERRARWAAQPRDRCPTCGYHFEPVEDVNTCPECCDVTPRAELIREDDDYTWTL